MSNKQVSLFRPALLVSQSQVMINGQCARTFSLERTLVALDPFFGTIPAFMMDVPVPRAALSAYESEHSSERSSDETN